MTDFSWKVNTHFKNTLNKRMYSWKGCLEPRDNILRIRKYKLIMCWVYIIPRTFSLILVDMYRNVTKKKAYLSMYNYAQTSIWLLLLVLQGSCYHRPLKSWKHSMSVKCELQKDRETLKPWLQGLYKCEVLPGIETTLGFYIIQSGY